MSGEVASIFQTDIVFSFMCIQALRVAKQIVSTLDNNLICLCVIYTRLSFFYFIWYCCCLFQTKILQFFFGFSLNIPVPWTISYVISFNNYVCVCVFSCSYFIALQPALSHTHTLFVHLIYIFCFFSPTGMYHTFKTTENIYISFEISESNAIISDKLHVNALIVLIWKLVRCIQLYITAIYMNA